MDKNVDGVSNNNEMTKDLVSVVIPTYNRRNSVQRAILSVLNQTYSNFEILVIDDGSTDDTESVVKKMSDSRIYYYRQENQGSQAARNHGIRLAKGVYIGFLDSDDEWLTEKLEKNVQYMKSHDADILFSQFRRVETGYPDDIVPNDLEGGYVPVEILGNSFRVTTDVIFGRASTVKSHPFDMKVSRFQDYDFILSAAAAGEKVFFEKDILVTQYHSENSISTKVKAQKLKNNALYLQNKHAHIASARLLLMQLQRNAMIECG